MSTRRLWLLATLTFVLAPWLGSEVEAGEKVTRYALENGLRVRLRPIAGARKVAVLLTYDVGEDHDPEGKSGLAHLVEHCYVTAAAGDVPMRTAQQMMQAYPNAWNAQTGSDYTVIAFIAPGDRLEAELAEAAARMSALRVTDADLAREKPRMDQELRNMFDRMPALAARNRAQEGVRPSAPGARRGGVPEQVATLTLEDVTRHHARHYKPRHAILVVAGAFDPVQTQALVKKHFGEIPSGEAVPAPRPRPEARLGTTERARATPFARTVPGHVCQAYAAPRPTDATYPAFLVLAARLFFARYQQAAAPLAQFTPLDAPGAVFVCRDLPAGATPDEVLEELRSDVTAIVSSELTAGDRLKATNAFAFLLGLKPFPDAMLGQNPYGVALRIARAEQLGFDGEALGRRLQAVTAEDVATARDTIFVPSNGAAAIMVVGDEPEER